MHDNIDYIDIINIATEAGYVLETCQAKDIIELLRFRTEDLGEAYTTDAILACIDEYLLIINGLIFG